ncbi:MAG: hypothetical protein HQ559_10885 [Lentisphaerae bacterium]|nr:hypothetical protein [Lentisphaerota bacterium]
MSGICPRVERVLLSYVPAIACIVAIVALISSLRQFTETAKSTDRVIGRLSDVVTKLDGIVTNLAENTESVSRIPVALGLLNTGIQDTVQQLTATRQNLRALSETTQAHHEEIVALHQRHLGVASNALALWTEATEQHIEALHRQNALRQELALEQLQFPYNTDLSTLDRLKTELGDNRNLLQTMDPAEFFRSKSYRSLQTVAWQYAREHQWRVSDALSTLQPVHRIYLSTAVLKEDGGKWLGERDTRERLRGRMREALGAFGEANAAIDAVAGRIKTEMNARVVRARASLNRTR